MAKRRKHKSSKCPEPLNTLIDLAGAAALGAYTRHKILKDYKQGDGESSVKAAMLVHGAGAMRRGSNGLINLGGVYGINSALKEIERHEHRATVGHHYDAPEILIFPVSHNNNQDAWRLNTSAGEPYGISPYDFDTKEAYMDAVRTAKEIENHDAKPPAPVRVQAENTIQSDCASTILYVRISRLDNGANQYFRSDRDDLRVGATVQVPTEQGSTKGIVLALEWHTLETAPQPPEETLWLVSDIG